MNMRELTEELKRFLKILHTSPELIKVINAGLMMTLRKCLMGYSLIFRRGCSPSLPSFLIKPSPLWKKIPISPGSKVFWA